MQPDPGQPVLAGDQVFVERLMLVPQNYYAENRHGLEFFKIEGSSLAGMARVGRGYESGISLIWFPRQPRCRKTCHPVRSFASREAG